jgi:hypothetical protein
MISNDVDIAPRLNSSDVGTDHCHLPAPPSPRSCRVIPKRSLACAVCGRQRQRRHHRLHPSNESLSELGQIFAGVRRPRLAGVARHYPHPATASIDVPMQGLSC